MKKLYFLTILLFFLSVTLFAQDYKWSVEANYPLSIGDELGNDAPGIVDLGIKYRFLDFNIVKIGAGVNVGVLKGNIKSYDGFNGEPDSFDFDETNWVIQPKVFAEFTIPGINKLHPNIGIGYTVISSKTKGLFSGQNIESSGSDGGINLNLGLSYDISKRFFLQAQYDYVRNKGSFDYEDINIVNKQNLGFLKFGAGFRF